MPAAHWPATCRSGRWRPGSPRRGRPRRRNSPLAARRRATRGSSNAPGTQATVIDASSTPWRIRPSRAPGQQPLGDEVVEPAADDGDPHARSARHSAAFIGRHRGPPAGGPSAPAWCAGSGCSRGWAPTRSGTRSTISRPKPSRPPHLAGLLVMSRMVVMPRSTRIWAPMPYSRLSTGRPELHVGVDGVETLVLELVGLQLVGDADPPALVAPQVDDDAEALLGDLGHGALSWSPQSQRSEPNTSPVRHSLCTRTSTLSSPCGAPITNARWVSPSSRLS